MLLGLTYTAGVLPADADRDVVQRTHHADRSMEDQQVGDEVGNRGKSPGRYVFMA